MSMSSPVSAPPHILSLLASLHRISLDQEANINTEKKRFLSTDLGQYDQQFDKLMLDKFIALDEDKCHFVYQLITAMGATHVVEAGTSFGVSTIYLALAVAKSRAITGKPGKVIATEKEPEKASQAREYWRQCGKEVEDEIDLRVGDLLETLKVHLPQVDLLLLDSKLTLLSFLKSSPHVALFIPGHPPLAGGVHEVAERLICLKYGHHWRCRHSNWSNLTSIQGRSCWWTTSFPGLAATRS